MQYQDDITEDKDNVEEWEQLKRNAEFVFFEVGMYERTICVLLSY